MYLPKFFISKWSYTIWFRFKFEGVFRQAAVVKGRNRDTAWFSIIDKEWTKLKKGYLRYFLKKNLDKNFNQKKSLKFS